jgi:hypothetical protein
MPSYEWKCAYCQITTETTASYSESVIAPICCNQPMARYWSSVAISFKGSGFYSNDKGRK